MSYILDALKKADKERKRGTVPDLSTVQDPAPRKPKKRSLWSYLVVTALLINAGIFLFWLSPWETEKTPPVVERVSQEKAPLQESPGNQSYNAMKSTDIEKAIPSVTSTPQEESLHEIQSTIPSIKPVDTQKQEQMIPKYAIHEDTSRETSSQKQPAEPSVPSTTKRPLLSTEPTTSDKQTASPHPPPESRFIVYDLQSLPASVKEDLPDINISVFVYSDDPSSRIVKINGQTVREGEELADGLKVEKIVPEGVIFNYEDYRFRVGIR